MAKHCNSITGINTTDKIIPAYTPVMLGGRIYASGFDDDLCFGISLCRDTLRIIPGVTACDIYPDMAGKVIISGIAIARIPEYFDPGDSIVPDGNGGWMTGNSSCIQVVISSDDSGIGSVFIGSGGYASGQSYSGYFSTRETGTPEEGLKVLVSGGNTDLGTVPAREFKIEDSVNIHLLAEYIRTGEKSGRYQLKLTDDHEKERVSDEFALHLISSIVVNTAKDGQKSLEIHQQWQNGEIFWGARYWV